jgi:hypothetical protein
VSTRIQKLEALLARVTSRASEPRAVRAVAAAVAEQRAPEPEFSPTSTLVDEAEPEHTQPIELPTRIPPRGPQPTDVEIDLPEPAIELGLEPAAQSDERIVAAKAITSDLLDALPVEVELAPEVPEAELDEEPAPSSSPRPVGPPPGELLEKQAFGEKAPEPALHTPPPESGKLPAASELPSLAEAADYDNQDITGVHHAPAVRARDERLQSGEHRTHLEPEIVASSPKASREVANVIGAANAFQPATFAELLDASLKL